MSIQQLENELWEAANQLRANSKLTAAEYSMQVLGLIFLRQNLMSDLLDITLPEEIAA